MLAKIVSGFMITGWLWAWPVVACQTLSEPQKTERLLKLIENSDMQFIRNGKVYNGSAARKHLERKLRYAGDKITTARQFIHYIASQSSFTGRSYYVHFKNGKEMKAEI